MTHRNISLDVLRTIAVILVLFRHIERPSDTSFFSNIIVYLQNIGWIGVDLFFTLSGYLISSLIFSEYKKNGSFDIKRFFIRRGFKIYPSFYVLILVTVLFNIFYKHREVNYKALLAELVYLQNYFGGLWNHTWSLAVEEHFYICLPLLLTYMFRSKYGFKNIKWWLLAIVFLVRLLSLIWRQQILSNHEAMLYTHFRIDSLIWGVLIRIYQIENKESFNKFYQIVTSKKVLFLSIATAILFVYFVPVYSILNFTLGFSILYVCFGFIILSATHANHSNKCLNIMGVIGKYSYGIYLWHMPIKFWVVNAFGLFFSLNYIAKIFIYLFFSFLLGYIFSKFFEYPLLKLRNKLFPSKT